MLKNLLYTLAACLFAAPIAVWVYLVALGCAYQTSSAGCGIELSDFWDADFLYIACLPWLLAIVCVYVGRKRQ